jgi:hypothetical protein
MCVDARLDFLKRKTPDAMVDGDIVSVLRRASVFYAQRSIVPTQSLVCSCIRV